MHIKENTIICVQRVSGHKTIYIAIPSRYVPRSLFVVLYYFIVAIGIYIVDHVLFAEQMFRCTRVSVV